MRPAKILYVIAQLGAGGAERQLLYLVRGLDPSRYAAELVTFTPGGPLQPEFEALCPVHVLPKRPVTEAWVMARLISMVGRIRPAVLHTFLYPANWRGAIAGRLAGAPVVVGSVRNLSTWMGPASRAIERAATALADAVVVNSPAVGRFMTESVGVRAEKLRVILNGVDLDLFRPPRDGDRSVRRELWGEDPVEVVGAVMSLTAKKRPDILVDAAARVIADRPRARFVIAGEGPLRGSIAARIDGLGLGDRVRLPGLRRDIPDLLRSLDLLALPSEREGLPNVVLEAMATGLPVVATAVGGTPDLVRDGVTGRLVPPGDPAALWGALVEILARPDLAHRMGEEGLHVARSEFGLDRMVERTQALYAELIALKGAAASLPGNSRGVVEGR